MTNPLIGFASSLSHRCWYIAIWRKSPGKQIPIFCVRSQTTVIRCRYCYVRKTFSNTTISLVDNNNYTLAVRFHQKSRHFCSHAVYIRRGRLIVYWDFRIFKPLCSIPPHKHQNTNTRNTRTTHQRRLSHLHDKFALLPQWCSIGSRRARVGKKMPKIVRVWAIPLVWCAWCLIRFPGA